jgi:hypothetical protein
MLCPILSSEQEDRREMANLRDNPAEETTADSLGNFPAHDTETEALKSSKEAGGNRNVEVEQDVRVKSRLAIVHHRVKDGSLEAREEKGEQVEERQTEQR